MKRLSIALFAALFLFAASPAMAQQDETVVASGGGPTASPKAWTAHLAFGFYKLRYIDSEFSGGESPASDVFGDKVRFMFQLGMERFLYQGYGTVGLEAALGYWQTYGKGLYVTGGQSADTTVFNLIPLKLSAVYRYVDTWEKYGVPLVPYAKLGLDYYIWWILNQNGDVASYENADGGASQGFGGTFGFHVSYGLQICLDFIDRKLANEFDQDFGVNNTYIYAEGTFAKVNDFWSGSSFDLSDHSFLAGLLFEF
ncbi:MAG: hypothetical protein C4523_09850 [Myxococcales bacterium]|nr:MAG: hypothetical protein C4523_09850 [Myxococcales bacterium]